VVATFLLGLFPNLVLQAIDLIDKCHDLGKQKKPLLKGKA
jgi:hypothetical protein